MKLQKSAGPRRQTAQASTGMLEYLAHLGRSIFQQHDDARTAHEHRWALMHIDSDGILQNTTVRVIGAQPGLRSLTVRREADEHEFILRISKIVEAIDIRTGRRVDVAHWLAHAPLP